MRLVKQMNTRTFIYLNIHGVPNVKSIGFHGENPERLVFSLLRIYLDSLISCIVKVI
jgi:hypothetical protein